MSCFGGGGSTDDKEKAKKSREIDILISKERNVTKDQYKLLLLGPGESGKSTIFKQMKIIQKNGGFTEEERMNYKSIILGNLITQMKVLIKALQKKEKDFTDTESKEAAERICELGATSDMWEPKQNIQDIKLLWNNPLIKEVYEKRDEEFQLNDSAAYFFDKAECFVDENYVPNEQDVLRARVRTTGIDEANFTFDDMSFQMVDVGGQRTERRKWIHCFQSVTSVLFCSSLSEYDQTLREDNTKNRMHESLLLFNEICNGRWFANSSMILFLNKMDLFKEKITVKDLTLAFPEYTGGKDEDKARTYILDKFKAENQDANRKVYTHFTCAVDTRNILVVFKAVRETIMSSMIKECMPI